MRWAWRLGAIAAAALAHEGLCRWLVRAGVVERLLAAGGVTAGALLAAALLFALRLALVFVAPGVVLGWVVVELLDRSGIAPRPGSANAPGAQR